MGRTVTGTTVGVALALMASTAGAQGAKPLTKCPADAAVSGTVCMDKYEASVWRVPDPAGANRTLVKRIQQGKATLELLMAGGSMQLGIAGDDYAPCADSGESCTDDVFAASLPGVPPSASMTWFQAQAACENARKRLPSNAEWQAAVAGTPDAGTDDGATDCNTATLTRVPTGTRGSCVSADGAFDMVGNLHEWVADWGPRSTSPCSGAWSAGVSPTGDTQCLGGAATSEGPGALNRGGNAVIGASSGPLTVFGTPQPSGSGWGVGFRCAR